MSAELLAEEQFRESQKLNEVDAGAVWDDTKLGLKHLSSWERMAVVLDVEWVRAAVKIVGLAIPGQVRVFRNGGLAEAKRWIAE